VSRTAKVLRARYENGVFKPLEPVDLRDGEEVIVFIRRRSVREVLDKYVGLFGKASVEELKQYEEEAQAQ
jgi:predicted DNA-binding antitoxin AbrB/MazE fold protein